MWTLLSGPRQCHDTCTQESAAACITGAAHILLAMLSSAAQGLPRQAGVTAGLAHNNRVRLSPTPVGRQAFRTCSRSCLFLLHGSPSWAAACLPR